MRTALALRAALALLLLTALAAACGGDDDDDAPDQRSQIAAAAFGARLLSVGEPVGTIVESRVEEIVPGLQMALNPNAVTTIASAVDDADERLTTIAETAGMTPEEFQAAWEADRGDAFATFVSGLESAEDADAIRDDLFLGELATLPVHPDGVLLGSGRINRPNGELGFFLIYDVAGSPVAVEEAVGRQLDETPWQVTGGQSTEDIGFLQFQSTTSGDIEGVAWVLPLPPEAVGAPVPRATEDGTGDEEATVEPAGNEASVLYLIEIQPLEQVEEPPFVLPEEDRPVPDGFPAMFLLDDDQTIVESLWNSVPGGSAYQMRLLTRASSIDVVDSYRDRIEAEGWELTSDEAVGFATVLSFASDDGAVQGSASIDTFEEDDDYTQIVLQLQAASPGVN